MKRLMLIALLLLFLGAPPVRAATTEATTTTSPALPGPTITITVGEEEHKKVIRALVKLNGKPLENATVMFWAKRTFGNLSLGKDTTLDDGTAVTAFPTGLPGTSTGELQLLATIAATPQYGDAAAQVSAPGGEVVAPAGEPFPRALWAPHAPVELIIPIVVLLAGVWVTYAFVISQIVAIWRGAAK